MFSISRIVKARTIALFLMGYFFFSCSNNMVYYDFQHVPDKAWVKDDVFSFHFDIQDTSLLYHTSLHLRNSGIYPYQNVWILYEELQPSGCLIKDTVEYRLADENGKWKGNGVTLFQNQFPIRKNLHYPDSGTYIISLRHGMRDERLKGVENIGVLIVK